jgi:hypothetical protein
LSEVGTSAELAVVIEWEFSPPVLSLKNLFIIFVDAVFTTLLEPLFTNAFDGDAQMSAHACVLHACIAD